MNNFLETNFSRRKFLSTSAKILTGLAGDVRYPGLWIDHALDTVTAPQPEVDNYLTLEVDEKNLLIKSFLPDGKKLDEIKLSK